MKVFLTAVAIADLQEIGDWVAEDDPAAALTLVTALRERCLQLAEFPRAYPLVPRYEPRGIRRRPYGEYLVFYRIAETRIEVLRILHGARDYDPLLFPDS